MPSRFSEELRKLRHEQKLTQAEMAFKLHVDPSRISRWEHDEVPPTQMLERISTTFGVNAHEWLREEVPKSPHESATAAPRVVHMKPEAAHGDREEGSWRGKAIDLLSRMTDLLESLIKNARGGGVIKPSSRRVTGSGNLSRQGPKPDSRAPLLNQGVMKRPAAYLRPC